MTAKEKAQGVFYQMYFEVCSTDAKTCAIIAVKNEYHYLRELLFSLKSCAVITDERFYLYKIQQLIDEEQEVIIEIEKL
jgi:hypothetical protein